MRDVLTAFNPYGVQSGIAELWRIANPGGGQFANRRAGTGYLERVVAVGFQLTTSATAANRIVTIEYEDGQANIFCYAGASFVQTASAGVRYGAGIGLSSGGSFVASRGTVALPYVWLYPGYLFSIRVTNMQAGDLLDSIFGVSEKVSIGPDGTMFGESPDRLLYGRGAR